MQLFCKCLNVAIDIEDESIQNVNKEDLGLASEDICEPLFEEKLGIIRPLSITKQQPCLLHVYNSQRWIFHKCLNCNMHTHAIHKESSNRMIVINLQLMKNPVEINSLKKSEKFSTIFKIVVDYSNYSDEIHVPDNKMTVSESSDPLHTALSNLQKHLTVTMQQEMQLTDQRVRNYQEEQYLQLEEFCEKAHRDYKALVGTIMLSTSNQSNITNVVNMPSQLITSDTPKIALTTTTSTLPANCINSNIIGALSAQAHETSTDLNFSRRSDDARVLHISNKTLLKATKLNVDCEGLFDLEGMDDEQEQDDNKENDSDSSNESEGGLQMNSGRHVLKTDSSDGGIARSLPISVPTYISMHKGLMDSDSDSMTTDSGMDIAASIKAIAKSVHGDTVFGELPRPRFRTQI